MKVNYFINRMCFRKNKLRSFELMFLNLCEDKSGDVVSRLQELFELAKTEQSLDQFF